MPKHRPTDDRRIATNLAPWTDLLVICRKCARKLDGGFGPDGRDTLTELLKSELRATGRRREVRLVSSACLGICPKGGVTLMRGNSPGETLIVPAGVDPAELRARLDLNPRPDEP